MGMKQGVVSRVSGKDTGKEDQYGNRFLRSFQLEGDEEWYGCGKGKTERITLKIGTNYHDLAPGDQISFFFEENEYNGKVYLNVKSSKISLDRKGTGAAAPAAAQRSAPAPAAGRAAAGSTPPAAVKGGRFSGNELSIKSGRAVNNAVNLLVAGKVPDLKAGLLVSIALEKLADAAYNALYEDADAALLDLGNDSKPTTRTRAAKPKAETPPAPPEPSPDEIEEANCQAAQAADDDFDDDIPF